MPTIEAYKPNPKTSTPTFGGRGGGGDPFYSSRRWRKFRAWVLRRKPLCEHCEQQDRTTEAKHVHHDKPRKQFPQLAFDYDNMVALCHPCHSKEEARRRHSTPPAGISAG